MCVVTTHRIFTGLLIQEIITWGLGEGRAWANLRSARPIAWGRVQRSVRGMLGVVGLGVRGIPFEAWCLTSGHVMG